MTPARDPSGVHPRLWSELLGLSEQVDDLWPESDLEAMFAHQLRIPLIVARESVAIEDHIPVSRVDSEALTLEAVLQRESPSVEELSMIKKFAKVSRDHSESPLAPEIATALYFAALAVSELRLGRSIGSISPERAQRGYQWCLEQPWIPGWLHGTFRACSTE